MTTRIPSAPAEADSAGTRASAATPTVRQWLRSTRFWIVLGAAVLLVAVVWTLISGGVRAGEPFASDNPGPPGAMALAEVLRQQGVEVTAAESFAEARRAAGDPADTTLLVYDTGFFLDPDRIAQLGDLADRIVLVEPTADLLEGLAPSVAFAGVPASEAAVDPECALPAAERAGAITPGSAAVQPAKAGDDGGIWCYPAGDGGFLLAQVETEGATVTVLPAAAPFDNEHILQAGNAALALNLLGATGELVWYLPGLLDLPVGEDAPSLADLTPEWVTPVLLLLLAVFVAAAVWRGRRLGPLVVENLPVVVPSGETMEGRARLYQRSSARRRALDALRVGAIGRIASSLGLSRTATVDEVVHTAARALGRREDEVRRILLDADPATDADLVRDSDALLRLERDVAAATDPRTSAPHGGPAPHGRPSHGRPAQGENR
ncbi:DUF4350 domain-containing protein [Naasia sp. SYSU D00057]|uniref:DUF4350 domain-containing protein n=1 Tax=Naasia sp. SYSU D00057 TaxID=2817380 RepID=UPI0027DDCDA0|nr:DUF4350 domain-containing protein [Naasia sp. SYSU D00057]